MKRFIYGIALICCVACVSNKADKPLVENPVIGQDARYCNPLPMEIGPGGNAGGDVTVLRDDDGTYYMYCSGGGAWVSKDFVNWEYHYVELVPGAPDVCKYNGKYYMSGNDSPLFVADHPLGPYTVLGDWENTPDVKGGWANAFDTKMFVDDDNQPYLFWAGHGISGIYAAKLDPQQPNRFISPAVNLITFREEHKWEHYGERNEYSNVAWIEGPWIMKHNGVYYLQYSASGTQWKTYAEGYYTSKSVLGPYTYGENNPLIHNDKGVVTGTAHGSMVVGPDNNLWKFYTVVLSSPPGSRRIGMDRVFVDEKGMLSAKVTDTPQWGPLVVKDGRNGDSGSIPVSINKIHDNNAASNFSSEIEGKYAAYATDDYTGTWWEPEEGDKEPFLLIDLAAATDFDSIDLFTIDGARILFGSARKRNPGRFNNWGMFSGVRRRPEFIPQVFKYKIEVSTDGENYTMALDRTNNTKSRDTIFEEIPPINCRFVKFTITDWPKNKPLGVIDFTIFGKADGHLPALNAIPDHI